MGTYCHVHLYDLFEEAASHVSQIFRAAGVFASVLLQDDPLLRAGGGPELQTLLLVEPFGHDLGLHALDIFLIAEAACRQTPVGSRGRPPVDTQRGRVGDGGCRCGLGGLAALEVALEGLHDELSPAVLRAVWRRWTM